MELTLSYVLSQIFIIINYALLGLSYYCKNRKTVLIISFMAVIANGLSYVFLNAYSGLAMCILALIRNIIFLIDEKKNGKSDKITKKDIIILIILYTIAIISAIFTYEGVLSLLSVVGTMLYTYSVWQKKTIVYKFMGIPVGISWIIYNIYIMSIFGIILETVLLFCSVSGYILELRKSKAEQ